MSKVTSSARLKKLSNFIRNVKGKTLGLCHGCFDVIGPGHIEHLIQAKAGCDVLVVTVTSDSVVKEAKGKGRPVIPAVDRVKHLAALECVDHVAIWGMRDASSLIMGVKPHIFFKGSDTRSKPLTEGFAQEQLQCEKTGTQIVYTDSESPYHTTDILKVLGE